MSVFLDADGIAEIAGALGGRSVRGISAARSGGNNRVFQVEFADGERAALKGYLSQSEDRRDRLGAEFRGLVFLAEQGVRAVPRPLAADHERGFALYEWIEGAPVGAAREADIDQATAFLATLSDLAGLEAARDIAPASEACLSQAEIITQINRRLRRLQAVTDEHPSLSQFLTEELGPVIVAATAEVVDAETPIDGSQTTLSPSDFGFHNALRRPDGRLVFLDFEYFGRDDPVKLVADFVQHPGMDIPATMCDRFARRMVADFGPRDEDFVSRLGRAMPFYGLRWCLILLNEFLPERWQRRAFAGESDRTAVLARQLVKARRHLAYVIEIKKGQIKWLEALLRS